MTEHKIVFGDSRSLNQIEDKIEYYLAPAAMWKDFAGQIILWLSFDFD